MKKLLLCGDDESLLRVRAAVLRKGGSFEVTIVAGVTRLMEHPLPADQSLIVLCNSLSYPDRVRAEQWVAEALPALPVITLMRGDDRPMQTFKHALEPIAGPNGLLELSRKLAI